MMFEQYFGGAIFAAVTKTVFTSSIGPAVSKFAPNLDPALLTHSGVTELRDVVPDEYLEGAILAYNQSINHVFVSSELLGMKMAKWDILTGMI